MTNSAHIVVKGNVYFAKGIKLIVKGNLLVGDNFICNCIINASHHIEFGNDVLLGWDVTILDGDGHSIRKNNDLNYVNIGNHVWVCSKATILKNTNIKDGSIIGSGAVVSGIEGSKERVLFIGNPAIVAKENVDWKL